jgi:hypothetical protein
MKPEDMNKPLDKPTNQYGDRQPEMNSTMHRESRYDVGNLEGRKVHDEYGRYPSSHHDIGYPEQRGSPYPYREHAPIPYDYQYGPPQGQYPYRQPIYRDPYCDHSYQNYEPIRREPRYEDSRPIEEKERLPDPGNLHVCMSESLICSWAWRECHYRTIKGCFWQVW